PGGADGAAEEGPAAEEKGPEAAPRTDAQLYHATNGPASREVKPGRQRAGLREAKGGGLLQERDRARGRDPVPGHPDEVEPAREAGAVDADGERLVGRRRAFVERGDLATQHVVQRERD